MVFVEFVVGVVFSFSCVGDQKNNWSFFGCVCRRIKGILCCLDEYLFWGEYEDKYLFCGVSGGGECKYFLVFVIRIVVF